MSECKDAVKDMTDNSSAHIDSGKTTLTERVSRIQQFLRSR